MKPLNENKIKNNDIEIKNSEKIIDNNDINNKQIPTKSFTPM